MNVYVFYLCKIFIQQMADYELKYFILWVFDFLNTLHPNCSSWVGHLGFTPLLSTDGYLRHIRSQMHCVVIRSRDLFTVYTAGLDINAIFCTVQSFAQLTMHEASPKKSKAYLLQRNKRNLSPLSLSHPILLIEWRQIPLIWSVKIFEFVSIPFVFHRLRNLHNLPLSRPTLYED